MPTIVPLTPEAEWLTILNDFPHWVPPLVPTVILAPHPDDETLGAGGLIAHLRQRNVPILVVAITDGENAYSDSVGLGDLRVPEQVEALRRLGVSEASILRLNLPDRDVSEHEEKLVELLRPRLSAGTHLVAPWPRDFHPDHEATGRAAELIAAELGLELSFYLFWTWHRGVPGVIAGLPLVALHLTDSERDIKLHALEAHASQFVHAGGQPILSPALLAPARRGFEVFIR
jgi:LmbE family N-acetylglucosaminyl deacetylase